MKKSIINIIIALVGISINGFTFSQNNHSYELTLEVNKGLPNYLFRFNCQKENSLFYKYTIEIYKENSQLLLQKIDLLKDYSVLYNEYESPNFEALQDINFDGYSDMVIECGRARMGKNICYLSFLFNKIDQRFYYDEDYSLLNLEVNDSLKQLFEAYWYGGCIDCIEFSTYQVIDGKIYLIKKEKQYSDEQENLFRNVEYYDTNGIVINKKVIRVK